MLQICAQKHVVLDSNTASRGGGILVAGAAAADGTGGVATLDAVHISSNTAHTSDGAGMCIEGLSGSATVTDPIQAGGRVVLTRSVVANNVAKTSGGGASVAGHLKIIESELHGNQALGTPAASGLVGSSAMPGRGGHVSVSALGYFAAANSTIVGSRGPFSCDAQTGVCLYAGSSSPDSFSSDAGQGAAIAVTGPPLAARGWSLELDNCTLTRLTSADGGTISADTAAKLSIRRTTIANSFGSGVQVLTRSYAELVDSTFRRISVRSSGGAVLVSGATARLSGCVFDGTCAFPAHTHAAAQRLSRMPFIDYVKMVISLLAAANNASSGGAMRVLDAVVVASRCTFANNSAVSNAGAVFVDVRARAHEVQEVLSTVLVMRRRLTAILPWTTPSWSTTRRLFQAARCS